MDGRRADRPHPAAAISATIVSAAALIDEWCGIFQNMSPAIKDLFEQVASWPEEDQEELARQIGARRTGIYRATPEELQTLDEAERSGIASDEEVEAAFRSFRRR
jgi:FMN phosphatase YigB (HAD superfamily)